LSEMFGPVATANVWSVSMIVLVRFPVTVAGVSSAEWLCKAALVV
jgi:hypothetical protein